MDADECVAVTRTVPWLVRDNLPVSFIALKTVALRHTARSAPFPLGRCSLQANHLAWEPHPFRAQSKSVGKSAPDYGVAGFQGCAEQPSQGIRPPDLALRRPVHNAKLHGIITFLD